MEGNGIESVSEFKLPSFYYCLNKSHSQIQKTNTDALIWLEENHMVLTLHIVDFKK